MVIVERNYILLNCNRVHQADIHNTDYHTSMSHSILHCHPFQSTIHTLDGRGQFHHDHHHCTTNQPSITQSASSPQLPAPVPLIINPDHLPSHSTIHSSVDSPDYLSANSPGNSSAQPPLDPPAHLQHHPHNHSQNSETKNLPHSPVIDGLRTETTRPKKNRHSSTDTELCNVMISPVFKPRLSGFRITMNQRKYTVYRQFNFFFVYSQQNFKGKI